MADESLITQITEYVRAGRETIGLFRAAASLLPKGDKRDKAELEIAAAERSLKLSEAVAARSLGYKLCQCEFPPNIMLSAGYHPRHDKEIYKCPKCDNQVPTKAYFEKRDKFSAPIKAESGSDWVSGRRRRR